MNKMLRTVLVLVAIILVCTASGCGSSSSATTPPPSTSIVGAPTLMITSTRGAAANGVRFRTIAADLAACRSAVRNTPASTLQASQNVTGAWRLAINVYNLGYPTTAGTFVLNQRGSTITGFYMQPELRADLRGSYVPATRQVFVQLAAPPTSYGTMNYSFTISADGCQAIGTDDGPQGTANRPVEIDRTGYVDTVEMPTPVAQAQLTVVPYPTPIPADRAGDGLWFVPEGLYADSGGPYQDGYAALRQQGSIVTGVYSQGAFRLAARGTYHAAEHILAVCMPEPGSNDGTQACVRASLSSNLVVGSGTIAIGQIVRPTTLYRLGALPLSSPATAGTVEPTPTVLAFPTPAPATVDGLWVGTGIPGLKDQGTMTIRVHSADSSLHGVAYTSSRRVNIAGVYKRASRTLVLHVPLGVDGTYEIDATIAANWKSMVGSYDGPAGSGYARFVRTSAAPTVPGAGPTR